MKNILNKLGIKKMDEMEKNIALKSQRNALIFAVLGLLVWSFYESYKTYTYNTPLNTTPCFLLVATGLVQTFSQLILQRQVVKDDEEYIEENPIWKILFLILIIAGVITSIGSFIILAGK